MMKKNLFIIFCIFIITMVILAFVYLNYQKKIILAQNANREYEYYTTNNISGSELMTVINKVSDSNEKNELDKDEKNRYLENEENSIKVEIKFLESDKIYDMEAISNLGAQQFVKNYNNFNFKCTKLEYHEKTKKIKYMLFEQI